AQVLVIEENASLGGHLRYHEAVPSQPPLAKMVGETLSDPRIQVLTDTTAVAWYQDHWLAAVRGTRLFKIRAKAVVVAAGLYENPLVFDGNDLPGVMLGSAVDRLIGLYGVVPGRRVIVVSANDDGWELAGRLRRAGVTVVAIVEERPRAQCTHPEVMACGGTDIPLYFEHVIASATGQGSVTGAVIRSLARGPGAPEETRLKADLIAVSVGWTPALDLALMAGAVSRHDPERAEMRIQTLPPGLYVAGRAAGVHGLDSTLRQGRQVGAEAAAHAGHGAPVAAAEDQTWASGPPDPRRTSDLVAVPGNGKQFVCYCEDVTDRDIAMGIEEGYESLELLKRYTTISMGPCQGKMCAANAIHLCSRLKHQSVEATGRTTSRPPVMPVSLGQLAGQHLHPVHRGPLHEWHTTHKARMVVSGTSIRPETYGDPLAEVRAVRERVGLIDVSTLGKLRFTGRGVPDFLERVYINRWRKLGVGQVRYGVMCSDEGVVLDDGVTARLDENEWYTTTTSSGVSAAIEGLQWWMQSGWGEGIHLTDLTEAFAAFNLAGPDSRQVLQSLTPVNLRNDAFPYMHTRAGEIAGVSCRMFRIGFTGELSFEIHVPASYARHVWEVLLEAGEPFGLTPFGLEAQRVLRLEKAHIIVGQDTDAVADALSTGLEWAVKLDKPDFVGRRSLVRVSHEGIRHRLVGFKMVRVTDIPEEGLQIVEAQPGGRKRIIGWVTSCRYSPTLGQAIGLCWLENDRARVPGTPFTIWRNNRMVEAVVHHGPFFDPEGARLNS
ncbi:MAG: glycine cleavage T C-terminal barrel domain-containing protein, partial [Actinoallomurus sp.]